MKGFAIALASLSALAACGDNITGADPIDAPPGSSTDAATDAPPIGSEIPDAAVDAGVDAPVDATPLAHSRYVIDDVDLPTVQEPRSIDVDGDGDPENKLGTILAALSLPQLGLDLRGGLDRSISRGQTIVLADLYGVVGAAERSLVLLPGTDPSPAACTSPSDTTCRQHLQGTGRFGIAGDADRDATVTGTLADGRYTAGPGALRLRFVIRGRVLDLRIAAARATLTGVTDERVAGGLIGGAVTKADVDAHVVPFFAGLVEDQVRTDCNRTPAPTCGCRLFSPGAALVSLYDRAPADCTISLVEVAEHSFTQTLVSPDVDVAPRDGTPDSLSIGVRITAVGAAWTE